MAKEAIEYYRVGDFALENLGSVGWPEPHVLFCLAYSTFWSSIQILKFGFNDLYGASKKEFVALEADFQRQNYKLQNIVL